MNPFKETAAEVRRRVAAVVVLYHPTDRELANLAACAGQTGRLYVVDNSDGGGNHGAVSAALADADPDLWVYLPAGKNRGIAWALNAGAEAARGDGYEFLLTLDQDTELRTGIVIRLLGALERLRDDGEPVGLVAAHAAPPEQVPDDAPLPDMDRPVVDFPLIVPTSGNLICLRAHGAVGGFDEDYFIDDVDFEYCLRLADAGYRVAWMPHLTVRHRWGEAAWRDFLWWKEIPVSGHSPLRRYYITRNRLITLRRYAGRFPEMKRLYWRMTWREWTGILLFETRRPAKIWAALTGVAHFLIGRRGARYRVL